MQKKLFIILSAVIFALSVTISASAASVVQKPYTTYTFSYADGKEQTATSAYVASTVIYGEDLNVGTFKNPNDIFVNRQNECYYIADTDNNRILTINKENKCTNILDEFDNNGRKDGLSSPTGLFVDESGYLFVADSGNGRVLKFDGNYRVVKEYTKPDSTLFGNDTVFKPLKVAVAQQGSIYLVCDGIYQGIVELDSDGDFLGFVGANKTNPSAWDRFWQSVSTRQQRKNMQSFVPVTFTGIDLDESDFLFATSQLENNSSNSGVKRLNLGGSDVIKTNSVIPMVGDITNIWEGSVVGQSSFNDVCYISNGIFAVTDIMRNRIFLYSEDGDLLFCFGNRSSQVGSIVSPSGIDSNGKKLYVIDSAANQITVFTPTVYCETMFSAIGNYRDGNYDLSNKYFNQLLKQNSNCEYAYIGMGKALMRQGKYKQAMQSFKLANNKNYYSNAMKGYRQQIFEKAFMPVFFIVIASVIFIMLIPAIKKRFKIFEKKASKTDNLLLKDMELGFYLTMHPFKGYGDIKYEHQGSLAAGFVFFALYTFSRVFSVFSSGFLVLGANGNNSSVVYECFKAAVPILLFVISNWCLTTLMDGEGSFKAILMASMYALTPMIISNILCTALSQVLTLEEMGFYYVITVLGYIWTFLLIAVGNLTIHNFTMGRTVLTLALTAVVIAIIVFIGFLLINLSCEVYFFAKEIVLEVINR